MAETPSPYAPGIISNEPTATRPASRAIVFLAAAFALVLADCTTNWRFRMRELLTGTGVDPKSLMFILPAWVVGILLPLWAYLSDRVPLFGTRREGYLVLAGLVGAAAWGALGFGAAHSAVWLAAPMVLEAAMAVSRAAIGGGLTEIGRRHATTGVMAAGYVMVSDLADLGGLAQGMLSGRVFGWTAGAGAGLWLTLVLLVATLGFTDNDAVPPVRASALPAGIPKFLRSRTFWAAVAVGTCAGLATLPRSLLAMHFHERTRDASVSQWLWVHVIPVAAAGIYLLACRRLRFATLLRLTLAVQALGLVVFGLAFQAGADETTLELIAPTAADALATVALIDLAMRAAPRGREAFGFILLSAVRGVFAALFATVTVASRATLGSVAWFGAGAAVAAIAAVSLLPRAVSSPSDNNGG